MAGEQYKKNAKMAPAGVLLGSRLARPARAWTHLGCPVAPPSHSNLAFVAIRALLCATDPEKTPK